MPNKEIVRVLRIIEYVGEREKVEDVVSRSIHGTKKINNDLSIRAATIGTYPEILEIEYPEFVEREEEKDGK